MRRVAVVGVGQSKFGELWEKGFRDIVLEAGREALEDADLEGREIEAMFVGNMSGGRYLGQEHVAALIADYAGLAEFGIPATRVEAADASGGLAVRQAYMAVASGLHDIVIAAGAEKVTDVDDPMQILSSSVDVEWENFVGGSLPALYAIIARLHMDSFGTTEEDLALVSVKNHRNGAKNPKAQFRKEIRVEDVLNSPYVAEPLKLLDCASVSDGAAAVILASEDVAREITDTPVFIEACTQASDYLALQSRKDILSMRAVVKASRDAYELAGVGPKDIQVAEVHDSFTIAEILAYEDLGFAEKGKGAELVREGVTEIGGKIPVNPSGGLKACGHAVGATGVRQIVELTLQLRGEAGERQVDAETGLALNIGGTGATAVVSILRR
ncbi:thiolase domain-containing protein [Archaeoglobus fulgidus]|jgi:acetyl-CoA C-acetyltransferase|uniref:3-ketoacyl-CoA thiolase (AcaB-12) n=4 Tax=Archaeoglobus TaxID=2233 RepID=O30255_ARCFU|nr:thiolase domain-containing protein [Archaeoglobus fulgidus]AAB91246.1 3-ketoacyl-CoA thiolase (acaB-12) [Archaeoglobus fulgidus DSM 4304]AIG99383.1 Acetyl-CoA acetyltransferase [Archaeoglobus fulgidus DSM 8774]KUJ94783.1 MAG: 3-ketoacyl-CoA thiolase (AcaB-12) [Archaeoglobus fulgidus]KUK07222.1 MAG: 3-ketoacyl-CoA thiolase (AcaB-12) [Archaeoglobus fulgidus]